LEEGNRELEIAEGRMICRSKRRLAGCRECQALGSMQQGTSTPPQSQTELNLASNAAGAQAPEPLKQALQGTCAAYPNHKGLFKLLDLCCWHVPLALGLQCSTLLHGTMVGALFSLLGPTLGRRS